MEEQRALFEFTKEDNKVPKEEREQLDYKGTGITLTDEHWEQLYDAERRGEREVEIEVW